MPLGPLDIVLRGLYTVSMQVKTGLYGYFLSEFLRFCVFLVSVSVFFVLGFQRVFCVLLVSLLVMLDDRK